MARMLASSSSAMRARRRDVRLRTSLRSTSGFLTLQALVAAPARRRSFLAFNLGGAGRCSRRARRRPARRRARRLMRGGHHCAAPSASWRFRRPIRRYSSLSRRQRRSRRRSQAAWREIGSGDAARHQPHLPTPRQSPRHQRLASARHGRPVAWGGGGLAASAIATVCGTVISTTTASWCSRA